MRSSRALFAGDRGARARPVQAPAPRASGVTLTLGLSRSAGWSETCSFGRQVQFWAPQASGAGVSLIMAYLNGNAIPDLLSLRALVAKFSGAPRRARAAPGSEPVFSFWLISLVRRTWYS